VDQRLHSTVGVAFWSGFSGQIYRSCPFMRKNLKMRKKLKISLILARESHSIAFTFNNYRPLYSVGAVGDTLTMQKKITLLLSARDSGI